MASVSMYASAMRCPTAWNVPIARSNCLRSVVYSAVMRSASWHAPGDDRADADDRVLVEDPAQVLAPVGELADAVLRRSTCAPSSVHHELRLVVHRRPGARA